MALTLEQWHERFLEQSRWTASLREFLFQQINFDTADIILEVGCGTGAVLSQLPIKTKRTGLDVSFKDIAFAHRVDTPSSYVCGDGYCTPFPDGCFDITFCHYLLLWLRSPLQVITEMKRITKPGGFIMALAEPDYAARIDFPASLISLGSLQSQSLRNLGVTLEMGRQLPGIFSQAGLADIHFGVSGFQNKISRLPDWVESEWLFLEHDLQDCLSAGQLAEYKTKDRQAWQDGSRVLWVPTFYAYGKVF